MDIRFYVNKSEKNKIGKNLESKLTLFGTLRDETSMIKPEILIETNSNITECNYIHIPDFGRYYFISDIASVRNGLWRVSCSVDVLESFKNSILNLNVILSDSETTGANDYVSGSVWKVKVKEKTDIVNFPSGLNESGEFILITAGG